MNDVIAETTLFFDDEPKEQVVIRIGKPKEGGECEYQCPYQIESPFETKDRYAASIDAVHALRNLSIMLGGEIAYLERVRGAKLLCVDGSPATDAFPAP